MCQITLITRGVAPTIVGVATALCVIVNSASAIPLSFNFDGTASWDEAGSPNNITTTIDIAAALDKLPGTPFQIDGIGWQGSIANPTCLEFCNPAANNSWVSEAAISFNNEFLLTPGADIREPSHAFPPHPDPVDTGGVLDLASIGVIPIALPDGLLNLEFLETFDDGIDQVDAVHVTANLLLDVSELQPLHRVATLSGNTTFGPTWRRPRSIDELSDIGTETHYDATPFSVDTTGVYLFEAVQPDGNYDGVLIAYEDAFDPAHQLRNLAAYNDDGIGGIGTSEFSLLLQADRLYHLVNTGYQNDDSGEYLVDVYGPEGAVLTRIPEPATAVLIMLASATCLAAGCHLSKRQE